MRKLAALLIFCLLPGAGAQAGENSSTYTKFDLEKTCKLIEKGDEYVYAGTWRCKGVGGYDITLASSDDRDYVGFGKNAQKTCSFRKGFNRFNSAGSPVEWRMKGGKPIAAIQRWTVTLDDEGGKMTWLVVTALHGKETCPVHYVAGSFPDANRVAQQAADKLAEGFDCASDAPTYDSKVGEPNTGLESCSATAQ